MPTSVRSLSLMSVFERDVSEMRRDEGSSELVREDLRDVAHSLNGMVGDW